MILSRSVGARDYAAALREAKGRWEGNSQEPPREFQKFAIVGASFVIFSHRDNIERLLNGTERRIGSPREA